MKYLFLLYADAPMPAPGTPEARKLLEDWTEAEQALTLRCVCALPAAEIAAAFLIPSSSAAWESCYRWCA